VPAYSLLEQAAAVAAPAPAAVPTSSYDPRHSTVPRPTRPPIVENRNGGGGRFPRWLGPRGAPHQAIGSLYFPPDDASAAGCRPEDLISRGLVPLPATRGPRVRVERKRFRLSESKLVEIDVVLTDFRVRHRRGGAPAIRGRRNRTLKADHRKRPGFLPKRSLAFREAGCESCSSITTRTISTAAVFQPTGERLKPRRPTR